jgi:hypothetical protein
MDTNITDQTLMDSKLTDGQKRRMLKSVVQKEMIARGFSTPLLYQQNYDSVYSDMIRLRPALVSASTAPSVKYSAYDADYLTESPGLKYGRANK